MSRRIQVKAGVRYGRLTIVNEAERYRSPGGHLERRVVCECDCGNTRTLLLGSIRSGRTTSCGCLANDGTAARNRRNATHGMSQSPTFRTWKGMKQRCNYPQHVAYQRYGGRGIKVCDRWLMFEAFVEDMGERPSGCSIDRIDNDGNYEPGNCRWATITEQARNKYKNVMLDYGGHTRCVAEWAEETGIQAATIAARIKRGWSAEKIMTQPVRGSQ